MLPAPGRQLAATAAGRKGRRCRALGAEDEDDDDDVEEGGRSSDSLDILAYKKRKSLSGSLRWLLLSNCKTNTYNKLYCHHDPIPHLQCIFFSITLLGI